MADPTPEAPRSTTDWAPCAHTRPEVREASRWLHDVIADGRATATPPRGVFQASRDGALEALLWRIAAGAHGGSRWPIRGLRFAVSADQWVGVRAEFALPDGSAHALWTEGDFFTLAFARTLERLQEVAEAWWAAHPPAADGDVADAP